jgi:large subunit ribosomal protein L24
MIICPHCSQPTRVRHAIGGDGRSERVCTNCGETLSGEVRKESRKK